MNTVAAQTEALSVEQIPSDEASWEEMAEFALTFNGYAHWGSFERCAEIANSGRAQTLEELRTCLFFEQRRWRHYGELPDDEAMVYFRDLLRRIRAKAAQRAEPDGSAPP